MTATEYRESMISELKGLGFSEWIFKAYGDENVSHAIACYPPVKGDQLEHFWALEDHAFISICGAIATTHKLRPRYRANVVAPRDGSRFYKVFLYCPGGEFNTGNEVYYGRSEYSTLAQAEESKANWEARNRV